MRKNYFVLILSAGTGSRMKSLGRNKPKSLLKVGKIEILSHVIKKLSKFDLEKFTITLGFKRKEIENFLKKNKFKYNSIYVKNFKECGSIFSWYLAKNKIKHNSSFILLHSDLIFHDSYLQNILKSKKQNIISSTDYNKNRRNKKSWMIYYDKNNKINKIIKKNNKNGSEVACINKFNFFTLMKFFNFTKLYMKKYGNKDTWEVVLDKFINTQRVKFYTIKNKNYWFNINKAEDLKIANELAIKKIHSL